MQINVSQLLQEAIGATREYEVNEATDIIGDGKIFKVHGKCHLLRTQRSILVKCALSTEVELTCNRCLGLFRHPIKLNFNEEFLPTVDIISGVPLPQTEETGSFTIDEHHTIDLTEAIRQYSVMAIPIKALCNKDCAGLCPKCGKNLNQGKCNCPVQEIDPRWSELTKLQ